MTVRPAAALRAGAGLALLVLVQILFGRLLAIGSVTPDLPLIGIFVVAIRYGQIPATVAGFTCGTIVDLFIGETVGISSLAKTVAGFLAGYFHRPDRADDLLRSPRFVAITLICSFAHNLLFLVSYFRSVDVGILDLLATHGIGGSVYTTVLSAIPVLILARAERRVRVAT